jgi:hypothetical protein
MDGDTFVWRAFGSDDPFGGAFLTYNTPALSSTATGLWSNDFDFKADAGYKITGYQVTYDLTLAGGRYLIVGGEGFGDFGGLKAGDLWVSTGSFSTSTGVMVKFNEPGAAIVTEMIQGEDLFIGMTSKVRGLQEFCPPNVDYLVCSNGGSNPGIRTGLALWSISVVPQIVAVPEPSTYALMFAGVAALSLTTRRRQTLPARSTVDR